MKEKSIFLIGLGTGLVITSIVALFSYNVLTLNDSVDISSTTTIQTEQTTNVEPTSQPISEQPTSQKLELSSKPNLEITTEKPFELSSQ